MGVAQSSCQACGVESALPPVAVQGALCWAALVDKDPVAGPVEALSSLLLQGLWTMR